MRCNGAAIVLPDCCSAARMVIVAVGEEKVLYLCSWGQALRNILYQLLVAITAPGVNESSRIIKGQQINRGIAGTGQAVSAYLPDMISYFHSLQFSRHYSFMK